MSNSILCRCPKCKEFVPRDQLLPDDKGCSLCVLAELSEKVSKEDDQR